MPKLEEIEQFKAELNSLGHEPSILADRGERLEDVPMPASGLDEDLDALLNVPDETPAPADEAPLDSIDEFEDQDEEFFDLDTGEDQIPPSAEDDEDDFSIPEDLLAGFDLNGTEDEEPSADEEPFAEDDQFHIPEEFAAAADILSLNEEDEQEDGEAPGQDFDEQPDVDFEEPGEADFAAGDSVTEEPEFDEEQAFGEEEFALPDEFSMDQLDEEVPEQPEETFEEDFSFPEEPAEAHEAAEETPPEEPEESEELSFFDEDAQEVDFSMPEDFPFEEPSQDAPATAEEDFSLPEGSGGTDDFDIPMAGDIADIDEADFEVDEFSLGDLGEQFGEIEEGPSIGTEEELNPALAVSEELPHGADELDLDDREFERLQETLNRQPLNLRIAIGELIGEKNLAGPHLQKLVGALVAGASPKELAAMVGVITGKKIRIPSRYEKSTGAAFEAEKGTFAYAFKQNILPLLRVLAAAAAVLGILTYLTFTFVYRPIHALILYNEGYRQLEEGAFREANLYFDRALTEWRYPNQFFRYADGFKEQRQFMLAEEKYEELLYPVMWRHEGAVQKRPDIRRIRGAEERGILEYSRLETDRLENFEFAEELLKILLDQDKHDYDALLAAGDNYLAWGEYEYERYEDARRAYATLIQYHGSRYELLFRMLRYFIRTDNYKEVARLKEQFKAERRLKVEPDAYAELGGYLVDKNDLDDVKDILNRAMEVDPTVPEIHYHLARYFRRIEDEQQERTALDFAEEYLEESRPLGRGRLERLVDTYNRQGEVDFEDGEYLSAEENYVKAKGLYEDGRERRVLEPSALFGSIYKNLGDLHYYIAAEYDTALALFTTAEETGLRSSEISYKKGYIHYNRQEYRDALAEFFLAADGFSANENLLYATGNALFQRSDYFAAQGYYTDLLDELEQQRRNITVLLPRERPKDRSLIDRLIRVNNNLGVTLQRLSLASGDRGKFSRALVHLTESTENFDLLSRDPETMARGSAVNLGYLNQRAMLYTIENYELQIYTDIPLDMETLFLE